MIIKLHNICVTGKNDNHDGSFRLQIYYFLCILISILFFSAYPLVSLPLIALSSPFVNNYARWTMSLLMIFYFILLYSSITPFSDIAEYMLIYRGVTDVDIFSFGRFGGGIEIFILALMRLVYFISDGNEYLFLFFCFTIIQIFLFVFCYRVNRRLSCLYFLVFNLSYAYYSFNAYFLRSMLSAVFLINAFLFISKKKYVYYFFAIISHLSSVLYIGVWEYLRARNKKLKIWVASMATVTIICCFIFLRDRIEFYLFKSSGNSMGYVQVVIIAFNYILCLLLLFFSNARKELSTQRIILFLTFFFILALVTYKIPQNFGIRISILLYALSPFFLYPLLTSCNVTILNKIKSLSLYMIVNCCFLFVVLYKGDDISNHMRSNPLDTSFIDLLIKDIDYFVKGYYPVIYSRDE